MAVAEELEQLGAFSHRWWRSNHSIQEWAGLGSRPRRGVRRRPTRRPLTPGRGMTKAFATGVEEGEVWEHHLLLDATSATSTNP